MRFEAFTEATPGAAGIAFCDRTPEPLPDWEWHRYLPNVWGYGGRPFVNRGHVVQTQPFRLGPTLATGGRHF